MKKIKDFLFTNKTEQQTIAKNTFWLFAGEATGRLLKMGLVIYAARVLGANGWGIFSYAISLGSLLMLFSDIGLVNLITREAARKHEGYATFISTAFVLKLIILLGSIIFFLMLGPSLSRIPEANGLFGAVAIMFFFDTMRDIGFAINRAFERMEREMVIKTIMNALILGLGIMLLAIHATPLAVARAYAAGSAVGTIALLIMIRKHIREFVARADRTVLRRIIRTALPLTLITLIGIIMANTDVFMLGIWRNATEIGWYASAQRIQQFIIIIPSMIATAVFPLASRLAGKDRERFGSLLEKSIASSMLIGIPVAVGGMLLSRPIMAVVFGGGFADAGSILTVLMLMLIFSFPLIFLSNAIFAYDKQKNLAVAYVFGVLGNVALNALLIPRFGAAGSAFATLISTAIITAVAWKKMRSINSFRILPHLYRIIGSSLIMAGVIVTLSHFGIGLIMTILIASIAYFLCLLALREPIFRESRAILTNNF